MKKTLLLLGLLSQPAGAGYGDVVAEYVKNYDGDTITVNIPDYPPIVGQNISVRVYGIDTPEMKSHCPTSEQKAKEHALAVQAKDIVASLLTKAKVVELREIERGKYFRILAKVYADGVNVADAVRNAGLSKDYYGETKESWCE